MHWSLAQTAIPTSTSSLSKAQNGLKSLFDRKDLGCTQVLNREVMFSSSQERALQLRNKYQTLAVLGMGGSSLGGRALLEANQDDVDRKVVFFDNVDSKRFFEKLKSLGDLRQVHFLVISKSGNTVETLTLANFIEQELNRVSSKLSEHCTVVTEFKNNPLYNWAIENGVKTLELPQDLGGRFSVFSPVGLLPAAFAGLSLNQMKSGISSALINKSLVEQLAAQALMSFERSEFITVLWPYCDDLKEFGAWTVQLWAESLAKRTTRDELKAPRVSTPVCYIGASDQHSVLQQVFEGEHDKFILFFRVGESESTGPRLEKTLFKSETLINGKNMGQLLSAQAQGTQESLNQIGVHSALIKTEKLNGEAVAELMMVFMLVVGAIGEALNINAFNQPGVEAGKIRTKEILGLSPC